MLRFVLFLVESVYYYILIGVDDIWMVYDATRSGLNEAVWFLWFPMSTTTSYLQSVEVGNFRRIVISGRCS